MKKKNQGLIAAAVIGGLLLLRQNGGTQLVNSYATQLNSATSIAQLSIIETAFLADYGAGKLTGVEVARLQTLRSKRDSDLFVAPAGLPSLAHMKSCYLKTTAEYPECADVDFDGDGQVTARDWSTYTAKVGATT